MFIKEDNTFHEIREKAVLQWLDAMGCNDGIEVRGGVRATTEYIKGLKQEIIKLKKSNDVKDKYLKKIMMKNSYIINEK